ncbi:M56 family metallopeptidase [Flavobacterium undicola]|uniref:M56 family metallopeptidase n=1 Tax=Flavobacterium undicola TaxID=1932779 RepID=UPI001378AAEB|nr:M56 family metallopeptidase [Flavobacterium undicola]MBA0883112.1 M56 family peptidase [Flavobacterium undicola]
MENGFVYLIKASGLIALFYFAYFLLLRKETFFSANRWFLLLGLITSSVLPLFFITKIIWIEPTTDSFDWSNIPVTTSIATPEPEIDWYLILGYVYFIGIAISLLKLVFDFKSLIQLLKGKTIQQQGNFKLIDLAENIAPFSYFNYIVYNSSLYTVVELENILEHEKVHSQQKHSLDVLISRLFCVFFWFNPLIWLYKKAIAQNLEFIADSEAAKKITDKKAYQLTLLKITTQENCVALTNHFYQSLIKKRIVMLNKNQSKKWNSWKYITVFPALVAFVFLFQIEVVAQEKVAPKQENETKSESIKLTSFKIRKDLKSLAKGKEIYINGEKSTKDDLAKLDPKEIESIDIAKINNKEAILITPKNLIKPVNITEKTIYIDGVKSTNDEFSKLDKNSIDKIDVNTFENSVRIATKKTKEFKSTNENKENGKNKVVEENTTGYTTPAFDYKKALILIDGKESNYETFLQIKSEKIKIVNVGPFESASEEMKKNILAKYGEKARNGVLEAYTYNKNDENVLKSLPHKTVKGFQILKQDQKVNEWKVEAIPVTTNLKEFIIEDKNTDYNKAVVIIDGKVSTSKVLNKLNPNEIASISVRKITDASQKEKEAVIQKYGENAINGVVEIHTKNIK